MRRTYSILVACLLVAVCAQGQWSTSTRAESTLYVCPGFYPGIVTFDDGSSIILGALSSYIYARKLDERGYYLWPPVQVMHNDSSFVTETSGVGNWGGWVSDGDGGVILFWYDHRGAYISGVDWANNSIYAQRIDKYGVVRWTTGGVKVKGPESGFKVGGIVNDGQGGCVINWSETEYGFPGARDIDRAKIERLSSSGLHLWELTLDSSQQHHVTSFGNVMRVRDRLVIPSHTNSVIMSLGGEVITSPVFGPSDLLVAEKDSVLFNLTGGPSSITQTKLLANFDTLWSATSAGGWGSTTLIYNPAIPDGVGGIYYLRTRTDSVVFVKIRRVDSRGEVWANELIVRNTSLPTGGYERHAGILIGDQVGHVWRFDSLAHPVWQYPVQLISNPSDTYFEKLASDNKGGMIMVYWVTLGGIYAQHSGRNGQVGIITSSVEPATLPRDYSLMQNYPNPFNPATRIVFGTPNDARITLEVFDVLGRRTATLVDREERAGSHEVQVHANDWASGIYFYRLIADGIVVGTKKMLLLR